MNSFLATLRILITKIKYNKYYYIFIFWRFKNTSIKKKNVDTNYKPSLSIMFSLNADKALKAAKNLVTLYMTDFNSVKFEKFSTYALGKNRGIFQSLNFHMNTNIIV